MSRLCHTDFLTTLARAVIFIPSAQISGQHIYRRLSERWYEKFDGDPILLPSRDNMPIEIPLVILQSRSGEWKCSVTRERVDIVHDPKLPASVDMASFFTEASDYLTEFRSLFHLRVGRLAAICNRFLVREEPGIALANHFCRDERLKGPLNRPGDFELHAHKQYTMGGEHEVNSWVRSKTGLKTESQERVIVVIQDINTLADQAQVKEYGDEEIVRFFDAGSSELDSILSIYFPE